MEQEKGANLRKQFFQPLRILVRGRDRPVLGGRQDFLYVHAFTRYKNPGALQMDVAPPIPSVDVLLAVEACELPACHNLIVATARAPDFRKS